MTANRMALVDEGITKLYQMAMACSVNKDDATCAKCIFAAKVVSELKQEMMKV